MDQGENLNRVGLPALVPIDAQKLIGCVCKSEQCRWHCATDNEPLTKGLYRFYQKCEGVDEIHDCIVGLDGEILRVKAYENGFIMVLLEK